MSKRINSWTVGAMCLGTLLANGVRADDGPERPKVKVQTRTEGLIRVVGPDGKIQEHRFNNESAPDHAKLREKLKELQAAAGDAEAVRRIAKELMDEATQQPQQVESDVDLSVRVAAVKFGIGVSLAEEVPAALRKQLKLDDEAGLLVQSVAAKSPAAKAGLQEYDLILAVDGKPIVLPASLVDAVQASGEQKKALSLAVISGGEHKTLDITPEAANDILWVDLDQSGNESNDGYDLLFNTARVPWRMELPPGIAIPHAQIRRLPANAQHQQLEQRLDRLEQQLEKLTDKLETLGEQK